MTFASLSFEANAEEGASADSMPPKWLKKPTATLLHDGRVLFVGSLKRHQPLSSFFWEPESGNWYPAGRLVHDAADHAQAVLLPSNNVMHIAHDDTLVCSLWNYLSHTWDNCSNTFLMRRLPHAYGLALADDGRAALVSGHARKTFLFNESSQEWSNPRSEWNEYAILFGAPVTSDKPLLRALDTQQNTWVDVSEAAGRYLEHESGVKADKSLFWDKKQKRWAYVLPSSEMGSFAQALPDGCIFAWRRNGGSTIFNPTSGAVNKVENPLFDLINATPSTAAFIVLPDSTVVFSGVPYFDYTGNHPVSFYQHKLTCEGFEGLENKTASVANTVDTSAVKPAESKRKTQTTLQKVNSFFALYKWNLIAVFGPFTLFLIFLYFRRGRKKTAVGTRDRRQLRSDKESQQVSSIMKQISWLLRILIYGGLGIYAFITISNYVYFGKKQDEEACMMDASKCLDDTTQRVKAVKSLPGEPTIPCRYVGAWSSKSLDTSYGGTLRFSLRSDGSFTAGKLDAAPKAKPEYVGFWGVQDNHMIWQYDGMSSSSADVNPIENRGNDQFILTEQNGMHTQFDLIVKYDSESCDG